MFLRPGSGTSCDVPLQPTRTSFTTSVRIAGSAPLRFLVDTGTSITVIDRDVAARLQIGTAGELSAISTSGTMQVTRGVVETLAVGPIVRRDVGVLIASLPRFRNHGHLDGILGMNFFTGQSVLLDGRRRCLTLGADRVEGGTTYDAQEVAGRVSVHIGDLNFVIDSGASFIVLLSDRAKALAVVDREAEVTTANGSDVSEAGTIGSLRLGGRTMREVPAVLARSTGDPREDGLLPVTLFAAVYFDAARTHVIVK